MTYSRGLPDTRRSAIFVFDTRENTRHQLTSGYYSDSLPEFDPEGKYLYFLTDRSFSPSYSDFDNSWIYSNATQIAAASLRDDVVSPLAPRNDEEPLPEEKTKEQDEPSESENNTEGSSEQEEDAEVNEEKAEKEESAVEIDLIGFERRVVILPPKAGNYNQLQAAPGKVVFLRRPRTGSEPGSKSSMLFYDLKEREEKEVLDGVNSFLVSFDNKKALVFQAGKFAIINLAPGQKVKSPLPTAELEMTIDPRAEWKQIFNDAWRLERDFFYDKNMHGVDWPAMKIQYGNLLEDAVTRWDVNYILGELIGELNASHTYRGGGDTESAQNQDVGLLGIDWSLENGAFRIKRIIRGADWDTEARSPLDEPGMEVKEGDYILAVNGVPLDTAKDPWASFQGLANKTVILNINDQPSLDGSKEVVVKTLGSENRIRHLEWIENNRLRVEEASGGKIGYIYVRSTGIDGQSELVRQFYPQFGKEGLIIDERFNSGGQIPDRFIEVLNRKPLSFWAVRDGKDWQWPPVAHFGPKAMLINGWSGSGGDAFPFYFREYGIGPLIGTKTWGGLIGMTGAPQLIDGGTVTCPTFRMYDIRGEWFAEGHGVDPDIEVIEDPTAMAKGSDPQLERAVQEVLRMLEENPPAKPNRPAYENRTIQ
jgi:tricorn protease